LKLTLFDLDHTLLDGDSDVLWCEFLMARGVLDRTSFEPRNRAMELQYKAGTVSTTAFCEFYISTLVGRSAEQWAPLRQVFLDEIIVPRIPASAHALVKRHQQAGELVVLTTATNRVITELTAAHLHIEHLIATECELAADGHFSGRVQGIANMRDGKVRRLQAWLSARGQTLADFDSRFYSDSINDLPLLQAVTHPVVVDADAQLLAQALQHGWPTLSLK
jgi:HAD superfamily hydrolase (TIGR01490 family)